MKFPMKDFFSKCDRILRKLRIWSHLLKTSLMENFIFCAVISRHHLIASLQMERGNSLDKTGNISYTIRFQYAMYFCQSNDLIRWKHSIKCHWCLCKKLLVKVYSLHKNDMLVKTFYAVVSTFCCSMNPS